MPLAVDAVRSAIIDRLAPLREEGLLVRGLPDQSSRVGTPVVGIITVFKKSDSFEPSQSNENFIQPRSMKWVVDVALANFVGQSGAETVTEAIAQYLVGFRPTLACKRMRLERLEYMGMDSQKRWVHEIEAIAPTVLIEEPQPETLPLLKQIIHEVVSANGNDLDPGLSRATEDDETRYPQG